ncbi:MAG TPA: tRNA (guanosine(46)-N7)-methyltransferase TrmB, partial [Thermoanaerobaculia bacterium]|nr:tRNA (guanosine(46)-N7)-methyltransferase TrmB [Thermoanaerobaculia bacterium]
MLIDPRETGLRPLDLVELFGNDKPVVLEIGSGKGRFLVNSAAERPDQNFLGVEKSLHYHRFIADRIARRRLTNVHLINHDA